MEYWGYSTVVWIIYYVKTGECNTYSISLHSAGESPRELHIHSFYDS